MDDFAAMDNLLKSMNRLGIQESGKDADNVEAITEIAGYRYTILPAVRFKLRQAEEKYQAIIGGKNPKFTPESFDLMRERLQGSDKRRKKQELDAIGMMFIQKQAEKFVQDAEDHDHDMLEKMFYPDFTPKYSDAMRTFHLTEKLLWRNDSFTNLENVSRLPLERCDWENNATNLTFSEWYGLLWGFYHPFSCLAYHCMVTGQNYIITEEFVQAFAHYLKHRVEDIQKNDSPILQVGNRLGRLAHLLNETKIIPVPVIATNDNPNVNPYMLFIPDDKQKAFKPKPIQKMKIEDALEKYEPSIVLFGGMQANRDETAKVRAYGCVKSYIHVGIPKSYLEGNPWETWGNVRFRKDDDTKVPAYLADGFYGTSVPHLSRFLISKLDSPFVQDLAQVSVFNRNQFIERRFSPMKSHLKALFKRW